MMRHLRRASLLVVAFSLLASAATAYAECACVLWSAAIDIDAKTTAENWTLQKAYTAQSICVEQAKIVRDDRLSGLAKTGSVEKAWTFEEGFGVLMKPRENESAGKSMSVRFICLPDTVDPRGPKGK